jgi:hypothetical protein
MARESLGRALNKPHVVEHIRQRALRTIQMGAARASEVKVELLDCGDNIARPRLDLRAGGRRHRPKNEAALSLNIEIKAGYVIDLTDEPKPDLRVIPHE